MKGHKDSIDRWLEPTLQRLDNDLPAIWDYVHTNYDVKPLWGSYTEFEQHIVGMVVKHRYKEFSAAKGWDLGKENKQGMVLEWFLQRGIFEYVNQRASEYELLKQWLVIIKENQAEKSQVTEHQWKTWQFFYKTIQAQFDVLTSLDDVMQAEEKRKELLTSLHRTLNSAKRIPADQIGKVGRTPEPVITIKKVQPKPEAKVDPVKALQEALSATFTP